MEPKTSRRVGTQNRKPIESEHDIQTAILDYLRISHQFFWRNNTGGIKKGNHFVRFGRLGAPDIFVVRSGAIIGLEVKNAKNEQSRQQMEFQHEFERAGGKYFLCRSLQDAIDALK